jgi:hypothetical protein
LVLDLVFPEAPAATQALAGSASVRSSSYVTPRFLTILRTIRFIAVRSLAASTGCNLGRG